MFQLGDHILAFQGHPEFSNGYSQASMDLRKEIPGEAVYSKAVESLKQEIQGEVFAKWIVRFIAA